MHGCHIVSRGFETQFHFFYFPFSLEEVSRENIVDARAISEEIEVKKKLSQKFR